MPLSYIDYPWERFTDYVADAISHDTSHDEMNEVIAVIEEKAIENQLGRSKFNRGQNPLGIDVKDNGYKSLMEYKRRG